MHDGSGTAVRSFGERVKHFRTRAGLTRPVMAGQLGHSASWLKAIETGRLHQPRLPMLVRMADLLRLEDLSELTGDQRISAVIYTKETHEALPAVSAALVDYSIGAEPQGIGALRARVEQAWELWHGSRHHRTAIAVVLPGLLADSRTAVRRLDGPARRAACALSAQVYHLAQLFLSFQPASELTAMTGDRAMNAAMDADDPRAMAVGAWYLNHVHRDAGQNVEARVALATQMASLLRPDTDTEDLARWGLLQLALALSHAKTGREGDAWKHWDDADRAARALGDGYHHPWLIFGRGIVDAYAVTLHADLMNPGGAVRAADRLDVSVMPSATRRAFHLTESARAHSLRRDPIAVIHLLASAYRESPDTARFSLFARGAVAELVEAGPPTVRRDAERLAAQLGISG